MANVNSREQVITLGWLGSWPTDRWSDFGENSPNVKLQDIWPHNENYCSANWQYSIQQDSRESFFLLLLFYFIFLSDKSYRRQIAHFTRVHCSDSQVSRLCHCTNITKQSLATLQHNHRKEKKKNRVTQHVLISVASCLRHRSLCIQG